jgi:hypothetical protein
MLNKAMWAIDITDSNLADFKTDPAGFLAAWESIEPEPPYPAGGTLTPDEKKALESLDFGAIYAMGANPFLLWQFARSVSVPDRMPIEELVSSFRDAVTPHGAPDFAT